MGVDKPTDGACPCDEEWTKIAEAFGWSRRECEVVRRILGGEARKRAAASLGITQSTVQTHLQRALWKAHTRDLIELMWKVVEVRDKLRH